MGSMGMGLNLQGQNDTNTMGFHIGIGSNNNVSSGGMDQWRLQQFPFLNGLEATSGASLIPFQSEVGSSVGVGESSRVTQLPPVKLEDSGALNLSRSPLSMSENNSQYYSWTTTNDLSGLASSSPSHVL